MFILDSYSMAVLFCVITMLCWGSWANTQKLAAAQWRFELFYWDYVIGILLFTLLLALTLGSHGTAGRSFSEDLAQASHDNIHQALLGGVVFNAANIALVLGVVVNYADDPKGNAVLLFTGVALVAAAILLNARAYRSMAAGKSTTSSKGLLLSIAAGLLMGFFYRFVARSMFADFTHPEPGKLSPYTALVFFSLGILGSNLLFNSLLMRKPFSGTPVPFSAYFKGSFKDHLTGILGGAIWCLGMSFSILASDKAGPAISYGLGQGATVVAAIWGIYIWKEFKDAPAGTSRLLNLMLLLYVVGIALIIYAR
jgi:glucose uptake protein